MKGFKKKTKKEGRKTRIINYNELQNQEKDNSGVKWTQTVMSPFTKDGRKEHGDDIQETSTEMLSAENYERI